MPTVISDQERVRRVHEEGSRRKRDLAALRRVDAEHRRRIADGLQITSDANEAWVLASNRIAAVVPASTFAIWFASVSVAGAEDVRLVLTAADGIRTWLERRYTNLILEALEGTGYAEVEIVSAGGGE